MLQNPQYKIGYNVEFIADSKKYIDETVKKIYVVYNKRKRRKNDENSIDP